MFAIDKHLHHALIHEHAQLQGLIWHERNRPGLGRARPHVGQNGRTRRVDGDQTLLRVQRPISKPAILKKHDARHLFRVWRPQHIHLDHRRVFGIDLGFDLHGIAPNTVEHHLLIGRKRHPRHLLVIASQRRHISCWRDPQILVAHQRQLAGQRHNLIPVLCRLSRVHVENHDDIALAVGRCRRRVDPAGAGGAKIAFVMRGHDELVAGGIVIPEQILPAAHVAIKKQDMAVANGPEIGTRAIVAHQCKAVVFHKRMQIRPICQIR